MVTQQTFNLPVSGSSPGGPTNIMKKEDLRTISDIRLLELYEAFVKMWHYEATNEFDRLRENEFDYYDVRAELAERLKR